MTLDEFVAGSPEALKAATAEAGRIRSSLDNWLVTLSVAILALPALLGKDTALGDSRLWCWLVIGDFFLLACVAVTLVRSELGLERIFLNASVLADMVRRVHDEGYKPGTDAALESEYQKANRLANRFKTSEWWLSRVALVCFLTGLLAVSCVALAHARRGATSANRRVNLSVRPVTCLATAARPAAGRPAGYAAR